MTPEPMATEVASEGVPDDPWAGHRDSLAEIADAIGEAQELLYQLQSARAEAVIDASEDGMPQREIGAELGISHTMVQKIIAGEFQVQQVREILARDFPDTFGAS